MDKFSKPTFVIGTGRSGLTPLMDLISYHPDLSWPSQYNNKFPNKYYLSYLSRIVGLPLFNSKFKFLNFVPTHSESYDLWNSLFNGFRRPFRDLYKFDVDSITKNKFKKAVQLIMKYQGKDHFIAEYSGWSRIGFFNEIFPECKFIHIIRDGRAVANSLNNVYYWLGWEGIYKWRWGILSDELFNIWKNNNYSFVALAAIQWKILVNNIADNSKIVSSKRFLTIRYEDMVAAPISTANQCLEFLELDTSNKKYINHVKNVKIFDANNEEFRIPSWKNTYTSDQIDMINIILRDELTEYSYL